MPQKTGLSEISGNGSVLDMQPSVAEWTATAEALFQEKERAQVTLDSIGDAVISTDLSCNVTYLNLVAARMTGWSQE